VHGVPLVALVIALSATLQVVARRWSLPHPVLLVLGGVALAFTPGLRPVSIDPDLIFVVFVPPILYYGTAFRSSLRDFRSELWPILRLGVLLVLVTIGAVAWSAHALSPEFTWPAAFTLGAIVAPPDPVAASAVLRTLRAPASIVSILEGEGLVNDATALVAYRVAVAAAVTGAFSLGRALAGIVVAGLGGIAIGLSLGWAIVKLRRSITRLPIIENTVSLLTPFAAYLPADAIGASGILSVVAVGLYLGRRGPRLVPAATRVQAEAMWSMISFLLESVVFMLVGLELPAVMRSLNQFPLATLVWYGGAISLVLVVVRMLWVFPSAYVSRLLLRRVRSASGHTSATESPRPWRSVLFVGWTGMRGGDSLVIALALPLVVASGMPFPARPLIIFITFSVIFATLVVQGLTLRPLVGLLRLHEDTQLTRTEEFHARRVMASAGLRRLEALASRDGAHPEAVRALRGAYERHARRWIARDRARHGARDADHRSLAPLEPGVVEDESRSYRMLRLAMIDAERGALLGLRDDDAVNDDVVRRVQRDLDLETMMLEASEDRAPESPYEG
jgi:CPA1 family monovalent cation:H+ antiporter